MKTSLKQIGEDIDGEIEPLLNQNEIVWQWAIYIASEKLSGS